MELEEVRELLRQSGAHARAEKRFALQKKHRESAWRIEQACALDKEKQDADEWLAKHKAKSEEVEAEEHETLIMGLANSYEYYPYL